MSVPKKGDLASSLKFLLLFLARSTTECRRELGAERGWRACGRSLRGPPHTVPVVLSHSVHARLRALLQPPTPCPPFFKELRSGAGSGPHFLVLPQGQSEQTYSTVKTGAPAVTVTNLKPATRYVFQIRAASPGPSWETQSFNPSIEVQTPEGK